MAKTQLRGDIPQPPGDTAKMDTKAPASIEDYRELKRRAQELEAAAKSDLLKRYQDALLVALAAKIEYRAEFGQEPPLPPNVKTFRLASEESPKRGKGPSSVRGVKNALTRAEKRHDAAKVTELKAKLASLTGQPDLQPVA